MFTRSCVFSEYVKSSRHLVTFLNGGFFYYYLQGEIVNWAMNHGLIARSVSCKFCRRDLQLCPRKDVQDKLQWICRGHGHLFRRSVRNQSWFSGSNLSIADILKLTFLWINKCSNDFICNELEMSARTVVDWRNFCREVCVLDCVRNGDVLGGEEKVVEIDESVFGKRKFYRGKKVVGKWVFGGVERGRNKCFMEVVPRITKLVLLKVLRKYVLPGTTIVSDCFKSYDCLKDEGFRHLTVNHKIQFKNPDTGARTNSIEGTWSAIKRSFRGPNTCKRMFDSYLMEYMWRRRHSDAKDLFLEFLSAVERIYTPQ